MRKWHFGTTLLRRLGEARRRIIRAIAGLTFISIFGYYLGDKIVHLIEVIQESGLCLTAVALAAAIFAAVLLEGEKAISILESILNAFSRICASLKDALSRVRNIFFGSD